MYPIENFPENVLLRPVHHFPYSTRFDFSLATNERITFVFIYGNIYYGPFVDQYEIYENLVKKQHKEIANEMKMYRLIKMNIKQ